MKSVQPKAVPPSVSPSTEAAIAVPAIRVLKISSCPSLSRKSTLTYELGCTTDSEIQIRISANSGGGFFSNEWVSLKSIEQTLEKTAKGTPISTSSLRALFFARSSNCAGFLLSVLIHAGLVRPLEQKRGCFETVNSSLFAEEVKTLIESSIDLKADQPRKPSAPDKTPVSKGKHKAA